MRKIRILNIVPDIYTEGIAVSVKDRQALAAALKEAAAGLETEAPRLCAAAPVRRLRRAASAAWPLSAS